MAALEAQRMGSGLSSKFPALIPGVLFAFIPFQVFASSSVQADVRPRMLQHVQGKRETEPIPEALSAE